jgi:hypothetical protein
MKSGAKAAGFCVNAGRPGGDDRETRCCDLSEAEVEDRLLDATRTFSIPLPLSFAAVSFDLFAEARSKSLRVGSWRVGEDGTVISLSGLATTNFKVGDIPVLAGEVDRGEDECENPSGMSGPLE